MRIMVGVSGGVDSAVALARLLDEGHDVTAVHYGFANGLEGPTVAEGRAVAEALDVPYEVWDFSSEFHDGIVDYFVTEYAAGRTPNPCVRCNRTMKFGRVLGRALASGFDAVATGHYARVEHRAEGTLLRRAVDPAKDQSYVLAVLSQQQLERCVFPIGVSTKAEVRAEAAARGLAVADKPDSLDICFIPDGDTAGFLSRHLGERPGQVVDEAGQVVGAHGGAHMFTVGQRKGLRLGRPAADGQPRYVLDISPVDNVVTVGPRESLKVGRLECGPASWTRASPAAPFRALVQVRAHGEPMPALIKAGESGTQVVLDAPAFGVAPGQAAVFYDDDVALGMATIEGTGA